MATTTGTRQKWTKLGTGADHALALATAVACDALPIGGRGLTGRAPQYTYSVDVHMIFDGLTSYTVSLFRKVKPLVVDAEPELVAIYSTAHGSDDAAVQPSQKKAHVYGAGAGERSDVIEFTAGDSPAEIVVKVQADGGAVGDNSMFQAYLG